MSFDSRQPAKGSPIDKWLAMQDADVIPKPESSNTGQQVKPAPAAGTSSVYALIDELVSPSENDIEQPSTVDVAVKAAAHGVKVLAPLLSHLTELVAPDKITSTMGALLGRVRDDANDVAKAFGVPGEESPAWLTSQIAGYLMPVLVSAIGRNNGTPLDPNNRHYLEPILKLAEHADSINSFSPLYQGSTDWQLTQALMIATSNVMTEYQCFDYFNEDAEAVSQIVTDYLSERVIEGTLADLSERWDMTESERGYLGSSLLSQSGSMLANCWIQSIPATTESIRNLPKESRLQVLANGYPLDHIFESFERVYRGIEVSAESALRAMAPMREIHPQETKRHVPGVR